MWIDAKWTLLTPFPMALLLLLATGLSQVGCGQTAPAPKNVGLKVDGKKAMALVEEYLAIGPKPSGTDGARKTAEWIADNLRKCGLEPKTDSWEEKTPRGMTRFRNVYADLPGDSPAIVILGSHYDAKLMVSGIVVPSANDGGSSTALLLEILRALKTPGATKPPYTIRFAFFDGEECLVSYSLNDGLHGSRRMAKSAKSESVAAIVLLDMIGDKELTLTLSTDTHEGLSGLLADAAAKLGAGSRISWFRGVILDDHTPFQALGIPAIDLIDFHYGPDNAYWHTSEDTIDKLDAQSLSIIGDITIQLLYRLPEAMPTR